MGKDNRYEHHGALVGEELSLEGIARPSPALVQAHADYLRLKEAREWLRSVEPENDIGLAMVGADLARAEATLRSLIARA